MAKRVSISDEYLTLDYIVKYKNDLEEAIKLYFRYENFPTLTKNEINEKKKQILKEIEINTIFMLLSSIEAWIRIDYEYRVRKRLKDKLSRELREVDKYLDKTYKISIEQLCDIYKKYTVGNLFSELKAVFKLRHWIAHGRYWKLKIGKKYDFDEVYQLAEAIFKLSKGLE
ncbi:MAG: hypothetical protein DSY60_00385 [Persephonella sp.]|nr:MAG: hypothetical protein DSY60_00385 [Persephonella sp.]